MNIYQVLLKPTITEKSTLLQESGRYTFQIDPRGQQDPGQGSGGEELQRDRDGCEHHEAAREAEAVRPPHKEDAGHQEGSGHTETR